MGEQAARIAAIVTEKGIPDPWNSFGACMDANAGFVNTITKAVDDCRKEDSSTARAQVDAAFAAARHNLELASDIVSTALTDLDRDGGWTVLDDRAARLDIEDVSSPEWGLPKYNHPFPITLKSL
jgi:hypothetical protein